MSAFADRRKRSKARAEARRGGDRKGFYKPPVGRALLYVAGAIPDSSMDDAPYIEVMIHYGVGPEGKMVTCLGDENEVLWWPEVAAYLKKRGVVIAEDGGCPVCERLDPEHAEFDADKADDMRGKEHYYFGVVPYGRIDGEGAGRTRVLFEGAALEPRVYSASYQAWDSICGVIEENDGISDPRAATLAVLKNNGKLIAGTYYAASSDLPTVREPLVLPKPLRFSLQKAQEPGGELDLFRVVAYMAKSRADVEKLLAGESVTKTDDPALSGKPSCWGLDCDPEDEGCIVCPEKVTCAEKCGTAVPGASAEAAPVKVEEPKPKPKRGATKRAKKPEPEPEPEPESPAADPAPTDVPVGEEDVEASIAEFEKAFGAD